MNTGEREEDRVERVVPDAAIEQHEAYAEQFVWATGAPLLLAILVLLFRKPAMARALTAATVAGTFIVAATAVRVGHAGGRLVYVHNAGAAYTSSARSAAGELPQASGTENQRRADRDRDR